MNTIDLIFEKVKTLKTTGALIPTSQYTVDKMLKHIDFQEAKCIVELGAGSGVITTSILDQMQTGTELLSFEINEKFAEMIEQIHDPRLHLIKDSAELIEQYLNQAGYKNADFVISSLPLSILPDEVTINIMDAIKKTLAPGGLFVQIQYSMVSYKLFKERFSDVRFQYVFPNLPPAFLFVCEGEAA